MIGPEIKNIWRTVKKVENPDWLVIGLSGAAGSRKSPSLLGLSAVRGPRGDELPLAIPELPVERELKLDESPTTPSSTCSQLSKATLTR